MFTASDLVERVRWVSARPSNLGDGPGDAISLAMGETSDSTPLPVVNAAVETLLSRRTKYERFTESPGLRTRIAKALNAESTSAITAANVVITHGASAGLGAAILTLINPGHVVVLPEPTYSLYADQVAMAGGRVRWISNDATGRPRLDRLEAAMSGARLLVMCNPSNPTGYVLAAGELTSIVHLAGHHGASVIFDEAHRDIVFGGAPFASSVSSIPESPHVLCCGTFSKSLAMTGWRLGWVLADRDTADAVNLVHRTIQRSPEHVRAGRGGGRVEPATGAPRPDGERAAGPPRSGVCAPRQHPGCRGRGPGGRSTCSPGSMWA